MSRACAALVQDGCPLRSASVDPVKFDSWHAVEWIEVVELWRVCELQREAIGLNDVLVIACSSSSNSRHCVTAHFTVNNEVISIRTVK